MNKFLNLIGLCSLKHHREIVKDLTIVKDGLEKRVDEGKREVIAIRKDCKKQFYQFSELLSHYSESQLNALYYELINKVRNDERYSHLVERWVGRVNDARTHPAR